MQVQLIHDGLIHDGLIHDGLVSRLGPFRKYGPKVV